jgi:hypothetical protein
VAAERKAAVARQLAEERRAREAVLQRLRDAEQRVIAAQQEAILVVRRRRRRRDCCRDLLPPPPSLLPRVEKCGKLGWEPVLSA